MAREGEGADDGCLAGQAGCMAGPGWRWEGILVGHGRGMGGGETHMAGVAHGSSSSRTEMGRERWEGRGKHGTDGMHGVDTSLLFNLGAGILQYVRMYVRMCKKTNNSAESQPPDPSKMPN